MKTYTIPWTSPFIKPSVRAIALKLQAVRRRFTP